jgi:hypothetical protein
MGRSAVRQLSADAPCETRIAARVEKRANKVRYGKGLINHGLFARFASRVQAARDNSLGA